MSCEKSLELVSSVLDGRMTAGEREEAMAHVESCEVCNSGYWSLYGLRQSLQAIRQPALPGWLAPRLGVIASHEAERRRRRESLAARFGHWADRVRLSFDNLMRPMALPVAGGLVSALLLFGAVVQQAFPAHFRDDVPTMMSTEPDGQVVDWTQDNRHYFENGLDAPRLEAANSQVPAADDGFRVSILPSWAAVESANRVNDTLVLVTIDPSGHVADYKVVSGELPREAKSFFLFSRFTPATLFGQPTWGKKLVLFPRSAPARS
jgi:hypothetical protein